MKHLFENIAIRIFEIDENDVGIDAGNLSQKLAHVGDGDDSMPSLPQALLDDRGSGGVVVDYQDLERRIGHEFIFDGGR